MYRPVSQEILKGFLEAFNRHDLDAILGYFAEDCVFYMGLSQKKLLGQPRRQIEEI